MGDARLRSGDVIETEITEDAADQEAETGDEIETAAETDTGDAEVTVEIVTDIVIDTETGVEAETEGNARIISYIIYIQDIYFSEDLALNPVQEDINERKGAGRAETLSK